MLKQLCFVYIAVHIIYIHHALASADKSQSPDKRKEPTALVEKMSILSLDSSLPIGHPRQAPPPSAPEVTQNLAGKLIHEISFDEKKYHKITKIVHVDTQEFFAEYMLYDEKALKEGKKYVMSVLHETNIESCERKSIFQAHLSLVKEMTIADRLDKAQASQDILFRQNYAPFVIPKQ